MVWQACGVGPNTLYSVYPTGAHEYGSLPRRDADGTVRETGLLKLADVAVLWYGERARHQLKQAGRLLFLWLGGEARHWKWDEVESFKPHNGAEFPAVSRAKLLRTVESRHFCGFGARARAGPRLR